VELSGGCLPGISPAILGRLYRVAGYLYACLSILSHMEELQPIIVKLGFYVLIKWMYWYSFVIYILWGYKPDGEKIYRYNARGQREMK
jgi:hypothetical protein